MFSGLSLLRKDEEKKPVELTEKQKQLQDYLAKYAGDEKKKKKKTRVKPSNVQLIDGDDTGFRKLDSSSAAPPPIRPRLPLPPLGGASSDDEDEGGGPGPGDDDGPAIANADALGGSDSLALRQALRKVDRGGFARSDAPVPAPAPSGRRRHDSDAEDDLSPPRRGGGGAAAAPRARHDSDAEDADLSPPRRPGGRVRQDSDAEDLSPPRRPQGGEGGGAAPARRRHDSDAEDLSPPRRPAGADTGAAPRRPARHDSDDEDMSPPRRPAPGGDASGDLSPPRRKPGASEPAAAAAAAAPGPSGPVRPGVTHMTDGTRAGIVSGADLRDQMAAKKEADRRRFLEMDAAETGRGAQTVYRDLKTGKKVESKEEFLKSRGKGPKEDDRIKPEWAGGFAQQRMADERRRAIEAEAGKSFHRTRDEDHEADQKRKSRWGDPLAGLGGKRGADAPPEVAEAAAAAAAGLDPLTRKRLKKSGFVIPQEVPPHSWIKRRLAATPNRFDIRPGKWWDGVDRSTGFEKTFFKQMNEKRQRDTERFMWEQEDM